MPINKQKVRMLTIPLETYRSIKRVSAETDCHMNALLAAAWKRYEKDAIKEGRKTDCCSNQLQNGPNTPPSLAKTKEILEPT
jgi:hypothetical protein